MPQRPTRRRPPAHILVVIASLVAACASPELAPVSPRGLEATPAAPAGVVATFTPTAGPTPEPQVAATWVVPPPEPLVTAPDVFVGVYAGDMGLGPVRALALSPGGVVFASVPDENRVLALPDADGDRVADGAIVFAEGPPLDRPLGLAFGEGALYVATATGIVRFEHAAGDLVARSAGEVVAALPDNPYFPLRELSLGPDGALYVSAGATCNACPQARPDRAAVLRIAPGGAPELFAAGLRHVGGFAWQPGTGDLFATDVGRDDLGDDVPPDEIDRLAAGWHYGFPGCFGDRVPDPTAGGDAAFCARTRAPEVALPAHSGPLGIAFYEGDMFPEDWRGDLIVALHGSVRRSLPIGYSVVRVPFEGGRPTGGLAAVVHGWLRPDTRRWGAPADVLVAPDGALLVSDDGGARVYRVYWDGPTPTPTPLVR